MSGTTQQQQLTENNKKFTNVNHDPEEKKEKTIVYLTRHGFRQDWADSTWKSTAQFPFDPPLSESGMKQAKELGAALAPAKIKKIFTSPYYRCLQAAHEVAVASSIAGAKVPMCLEIGVGERFSEDEAKKHIPGVPDRPELEELLVQFPYIDPSYEPLASQHALRESKAAVTERGRVMAARISEVVQKEKGSYLIVTHASPLICFVRGFVNDDQFKVHTGTCSITKLVWDEEQKRWKVKMNGSCTHLSEGEQRAYSFSDEV